MATGANEEDTRVDLDIPVEEELQVEGFPQLRHGMVDQTEIHWEETHL